MKKHERPDEPSRQQEQSDEQGSRIMRPDVSAAHIILLILSHRGPTSFKDLMRHHAVHALGTERTANSFYTALARLKRRKSIIRTVDRTYELTPAGEYAALKAYVRKEFVQTEKSGNLAAQTSRLKSSATSAKWDGKWRLVFFDVPESKRPIRDYIRGVLKRIGCKEFQRSMWIHPHKLPPFVMKLLEDPQLRKYARVITTYDIDYDDDLRRHFRLG